MVKIGNPRPAVQRQGPPPKLDHETELSRAIREDFKRRNGGKSPTSADSDDGQDDDVWSQSSNKNKQGYTADDLRVPISSTILPTVMLIL